MIKVQTMGTELRAVFLVIEVPMTTGKKTFLEGFKCVSV